MGVHSSDLNQLMEADLYAFYIGFFCIQINYLVMTDVIN